MDAVEEMEPRTKIMILGPVAFGKKGTHKKLLEQLRREGYVRVRVDGEIRILADDIILEKTKKHTIEVVVDRIIIKEGITKRLTDSVETALQLGNGMAERIICSAFISPVRNVGFPCPNRSQEYSHSTILWGHVLPAQAWGHPLKWILIG